jgi:hypothetical protein
MGVSLRGLFPIFRRRTTSKYRIGRFVAAQSGLGWAEVSPRYVRHAEFLTEAIRDQQVDA